MAEAAATARVAAAIESLAICGPGDCGWFGTAQMVRRTPNACLSPLSPPDAPPCRRRGPPVPELPVAALMRMTRPRRLRPDDALLWPSASARSMSASCPKRTKPKPLEWPVRGSHIILAARVDGKSGVKSDCAVSWAFGGSARTTSSASVTSRARSPTKTLCSDWYDGMTPGRPVAQLTVRSAAFKEASHARLKVRCELGMRVRCWVDSKWSRTDEACDGLEKVRKQ